MKIRLPLRKLLGTLSEQIRNETDGHNCHQFSPEGYGCIICGLYDAGKPLATLHYARHRGFFRNRMLGAERELFELLGEDKFRSKMLEEIRAVKNFPTKECFNCGKRIIVFDTYTSVRKSVFRNRDRFVEINCFHCNSSNTFVDVDLPYYQPKGKTKKSAVLPATADDEVYFGADEEGM